jgi:hypothetical protein
MAVTELLTTMADEGGLLHAIYPTAAKALCGLLVDELKEPHERGRSVPPGCGHCVQVAEKFDLIDRSAPPHWFRTAPQTAAPT